LSSATDRTPRERIDGRTDGRTERIERASARSRGFESSECGAIDDDDDDDDAWF
jgi:hypothetical protein